jgi:hypothetical protein
MRCSRSHTPIPGNFSVWPVAVVGLLAIALGGCFTARQPHYQHQSYAGAPAHHQVAVVVPSPKVAVEEDGLPSQHPPRVRRIAEPDDPREPFSPNYGPAPERAYGQDEVSPTAVPLRQVNMSDEEAERLIGRAIAAHEVRRP